MKTYFCTIFLFVFSISLGQKTNGTSETRLQTIASVSINSNGIATIPAFSLNKPALMASVSLIKSRFSYDPLLAYGLDMKPWFIDNWLHYKIINKPGFELRTGVNFSTFFTNQEAGDETFLKGERYFAFALEGMYRISPKSSLTLMYWSDNGQEPGTISGHFLNLVGDRSDIKLGNNVSMGVNIQIFYINYTGETDGLFVSPKISAGLINVPFTLFFQATQSLISNISPWPGFRWNIGLAYFL